MATPLSVAPLEGAGAIGAIIIAPAVATRRPALGVEDRRVAKTAVQVRTAERRRITPFHCRCYTSSTTTLGHGTHCTALAQSNYSCARSLSRRW